MSPLATQTTTPSRKPPPITTNNRRVNPEAKQRIKEYAQTLQVATDRANVNKPSNPESAYPGSKDRDPSIEQYPETLRSASMLADTPEPKSIDPNNLGDGLNSLNPTPELNSTLSPSSGCTGQTCVCGGCGTKSDSAHNPLVEQDSRDSAITQEPKISQTAPSLNSDPAADGLGINPLGDDLIQLNGFKGQPDITSPGLDCATKSCAVCGACRPKIDLVNIASGNQNIEEANNIELQQNQGAILYMPPDNQNLIGYVNFAKNDFPVANLINPPSLDQPVVQGQSNLSANRDPANPQHQDGTHISPVPPSSQTDPTPSQSAQGDLPNPAATTPQPNPEGSTTPPAQSPDPVSPTPPSGGTAPDETEPGKEETVPSSQPTPPTPSPGKMPEPTPNPEESSRKPSSTDPSSSSAPSKCPLKNLISAVQQFTQNLAESIKGSVEGIKSQISTAVIVFGGQVGLTQIDQGKLTQDLQSVIGGDDKLNTTQEYSSVSSSQRPEPQNSPKSGNTENSVAAENGTPQTSQSQVDGDIKATTNFNVSASVKADPNSLTNNAGAAPSSDANAKVARAPVQQGPGQNFVSRVSTANGLASQNVSRSPFTGRLSQSVLGVLAAFGQSVDQIKAAVSTLNRLVANSSLASAKQDPQIVNGSGNSQNTSPKAALVALASSPQLQNGSKILTNSPTNRISPLTRNSTVVPSKHLILDGSNVAPANLKSQPQSRISGLNNPSSTLGDSNLKLSPRQPQIDSRIPSLGTLSERLIAVAGNLENLASTKPLNPNNGNSAVAPQPQLNVAKLNRTPRPTNTLGSSNLTTIKLKQPTLNPSRSQASSSQNLSTAQNPSASLALSSYNLSRSLVQVAAKLRLALSKHSILARSQLNQAASFGPQPTNRPSQFNQLAARNFRAIAQSLLRLSRNFRRFDRITLASKVNVTSQASLRTTGSTQAALKPQALARVVSNLKARVPKSANLVTRANFAQIRQNLKIRLLGLGQEIFRVINQKSFNGLVHANEANIGRKLSQTLSRLRYLTAQARGIKTRQASLKSRNLALVVKRNLNNSPSTLRASSRYLRIQAKVNLVSRTAQSLRRSLLARFLLLQRRPLAAKGSTARATRFVSQTLASEAVLRAHLLQRKITLASLRLNARKFAKLKLSQRWHELLERVKLAGKTSQDKVSHLRKVLGTPQKDLNSLSSNAQLGSWQELMRRRDLIVRFNSVAERFLPLLLRSVNLIRSLSSKHPFWLFLLELLQRKDKKKEWFKNNKVFLAQFLYIFSLILKRLNRAGRKVESLSPQELVALVRKALRKAVPSASQQTEFVSAKQSKGSKTIFAVNKAATPDKNLSIFQAKI